MGKSALVTPYLTLPPPHMHLGLSYLTPRGFQDSEGGLCSREWNDSCEELVVNHRLLTWQRDRYRNSDKVRFLVNCQIYGYFFGLPFSIFYLDFILLKRRWKKCRIWSTSMFRGIALAQRWRKARCRGGFKRIPVVSIWHVRERLDANPPQGRYADAGSLLIRFVKDFPLCRLLLCSHHSYVLLLIPPGTLPTSICQWFWPCVCSNTYNGNAITPINDFLCSWHISRWKPK